MQNFQTELAKHVGAITELSIKTALESAEKGFTDLKTKVEAEMEQLIGSRPVMAVKINEVETKTLKSRANPVLARMVINAKLGLYTMLVGPAGCGKTTAASQLAEAMGLQFGTVCLTAGASETWLFGRQTPIGFVEGIFSKIYREGGVFLADEIDAADANLLLSINTSLSHNFMLNPMNGELIPKHPDFVFVSAANTNGKGSSHIYTGRTRLDAATLDRMTILTVDYDKALERELCPEKAVYFFLSEVRKQLKSEGYDEFISTRAFVSSSKLIRAGIELSDIKDSLISNWGDAAKGVAETVFRKMPSVETGPKGVSVIDEANPRRGSAKRDGKKVEFKWE